MMYVTYNDTLALHLLVLWMIWTGICHCYNCYKHDGETKKWQKADIFDGILLITVMIIPVFF